MSAREVWKLESWLIGPIGRLWDGLESLEKDYQVEATSSPSGVTPVTFTRTAV